MRRFEYWLKGILFWLHVGKKTAVLIKSCDLSDTGFTVSNRENNQEQV